MNPATAQLIAQLAHDRQRDADGPHIDHVAEVVKAVAGDPETEMVAWLHDVPEDTWVECDILALCFPPVVVGSVRLMTHDPAVPYDDYVEAIATAPGGEGLLARRVKYADAKHNRERCTLARDPRAAKYAVVEVRISKAMRERGEWAPS